MKTFWISLHTQTLTCEYVLCEDICTPQLYLLGELKERKLLKLSRLNVFTFWVYYFLFYVKFNLCF